MQEAGVVKLMMPASPLNRVSVGLVQLGLEPTTLVSVSLDSQEPTVLRTLMTVLVVNVSTVLV